MTIRSQLVFDFDGLLADTESSAHNSWCEVYGEHGCELPFDRWIEYIGREVGWLDAAERLEELVGRQLDREAVAPNAGSCTPQLSRRWISPPESASASSSRRSAAPSRDRDELRDHMGAAAPREPELLQCVGRIVCREPPMRAKPESDVYLEALRRLGSAASETVAFETR